MSSCSCYSISVSGGSLFLFILLFYFIVIFVYVSFHFPSSECYHRRRLPTMVQQRISNLLTSSCSHLTSGVWRLASELCFTLILGHCWKYVKFLHIVSLLAGCTFLYLIRLRMCTQAKVSPQKMITNTVDLSMPFYQNEKLNFNRFSFEKIV